MRGFSTTCRSEYDNIIRQLSRPGVLTGAELLAEGFVRNEA